MGSGIAQLCARHGFPVVLFDVNENALAAAKKKIAEEIETLVRNNKIDPSDDVMARLHFTPVLNDCVADVIIEAVAEKLNAKIALFQALAAINDPSAVFATNTSSLSVSAIAAELPVPAQQAGMHFFNPATVMKLVEVVTTRYSSAKTINTIVTLAQKIDKVPVVCTDAPGFIVNHVARPYYLEALHVMEQLAIAPADIDSLMESAGFRMGPFRLMDLIGNDINYSVSCIVYEALGRPPRLKPSTVQKEKVASGQLGRKTGKGYYDYAR
jgi:3-hydroxybutyryl-CoA dehydrogenase